MDLQKRACRQREAIWQYHFPSTSSNSSHRSGPACIAARDSRTLVVFHGFENQELPDWARQDFQQSSTQWDQAWENLDTGMISLISSSHGIEPALFVSEKANVRALDQIFDNIEQIGYGFDWNEALGQIGIKVGFGCQNRLEAAAVEQAIIEFTTLRLEEAAGQLAELDALNDSKSTESPDETPGETLITQREECLQAIDFLENYQINTRVNADETVTVEVVATMGFSLDDLLQNFFPSPKNVAQAPKEETTK